MTPTQIIVLIGGVWLVGSGVGGGLFLLLAHRIYGRGVLAGQQQAELTHGWPATHVNVGHPGDESWALLDRRQVRSLAQPRSHDL